MIKWFKKFFCKHEDKKILSLVVDECPPIEFEDENNITYECNSCGMKISRHLSYEETLIEYNRFKELL